MIGVCTSFCLLESVNRKNWLNFFSRLNSSLENLGNLSYGSTIDRSLLSPFPHKTASHLINETDLDERRPGLWLGQSYEIEAH